MDEESDFIRKYKKILKFGYDPADDAYEELEKGAKYREGKTEEGLRYCIYDPPQPMGNDSEHQGKIEMIINRYWLLKTILTRVENSDDISWNDVSRHYERIKQEYLHLQEILESIILDQNRKEP